MPRSEDYLDSLLDSITEGNNKPDKSDRKDTQGTGALSESQFLLDFENDVLSDLDESDSDDFLREFEKDMGFEIGEGKRDSERVPDQEPIPARDTKDSGESRLDSLLEDLEGSSRSDIDTSLDSDLEDAVRHSSEPAPQRDIMDNLMDILSGEEDTLSDVSSDTGSGEPSGNPASENVLEDSGDVLEETEDVLEETGEETTGEASGDVHVPGESDDGTDVLEETEDILEETGEGTGESGAEKPQEAAQGEGENISNEEIMDIGNLLDSIDAEGNLTEAEMDKPAAELRDETPETEGEAVEGEEEKQSFIQKLLGRFKKKKKKDGDEEGAEEEGQAEAEAVMAAVQDEEVEQAEPIDKKAAKKEEKERKKKEKEEAKKKAKADKEKAAKNKAPKEKKPKKKRQPDTSPKIPIIVIIPFVVLALSIFLLWNVLKDNLSYTLTVRSARSQFDKGNYLDSYNTLSGLELNTDDVLLGQRAMLLAQLEHRWSSYEVFSDPVNLSHIYALDSLVRGVTYYADHVQESETIAIKDSFDDIGGRLVNTLQEVYGLTPEEAYSLVEIRDRKDYTRELYYILYDRGLWDPYANPIKEESKSPTDTENTEDGESTDTGDSATNDSGQQTGDSAASDGGQP